MDKKEQARLRKRKQRDKEKLESVTLGCVTGGSVTRIGFIQDALNDDDLVGGIEGAARIFKDREARYERAYRYFLWRKGEKIEPTLPYALTQDRLRLEKITQSLKEFNQEENVYYGCRDPIPFDVVGDLLEATR